MNELKIYGELSFYANTILERTKLRERQNLPSDINERGSPIDGIQEWGVGLPNIFTSKNIFA